MVEIAPTWKRRMKIWYRFVDANGNAFCETGEDCIRIDLTQKYNLTIGDLKGLIYTKNPNILVHLDDASELDILNPENEPYPVELQLSNVKSRQPLRVKVPESFQDPLMNSILAHAFMDPISDTSSSSGFKKNLIETYECDLGSDMLRCMLFDTGFPSPLVQEIYLFRRENAYLSNKWMYFRDIDDVRNGLLLFEPIQKAFDALDLGFLVDDSSKHEAVYYLKIFNPHIRSKLLVDTLTLRQCQEDLNLPIDWKKSDTTCSSSFIAPAFNLTMTFGDLEGKKLVFTRTNPSPIPGQKQPKRPWRRCLYFHAFLARIRAIENKKNRWESSPEEDKHPIEEMEDFSVKDMKLKQKIQKIFF